MVLVCQSQYGIFPLLQAWCKSRPTSTAAFVPEQRCWLLPSVPSQLTMLRVLACLRLLHLCGRVSAAANQLDAH